ncbi:hypothetical protein EDD30_0498 [Couchioplanes caeruleus]|uniref:Uncharacterized protein n=1 Tax=Couchioplanes caeruleus TaxID=56438 RepID=A0A3N1GC23_9ACTN|nr:hypothetical protein EDD30_0498 [Couchioplanes caeruleus]
MHSEVLHALDAHLERMTTLRRDLVAKRSMEPGERLRLAADAATCAQQCAHILTRLLATDDQPDAAQPVIGSRIGLPSAHSQSSAGTPSGW